MGLPGLPQIQVNVIRKPAIQPKVSMKTLYWTRIQLTQPQTSMDSSSTIWDAVDDVVLETGKLEEMFSKADLKSKPKEEKEVKKPDKVAKIIDGKKSQNVGIFLRSKKIDVDMVKQVLIECDTSWEKETLVQLQGFKPNPEDELVMLRDHVTNKPDVPLDGPDQFLYEMSQIHMFDQRLSCILFQLTFSNLCEDVAVKMDYIKTCCNYLLRNQELKNVLGVILACGNYLNGGNKQRGQADGFAVDILPKLKDVKTKDNFSNLLGYIVRTYIDKYDLHRGTPESLLPVPEPGDLDKARAVDFDAERTECKNLLQKLNLVRNHVEKISNSCQDDMKEPFHRKMVKFLDTAQSQLTNLETCIESNAEKYVEMLRFFKYTPRKGKLEDTKPSDFFDVWFLFCEDFKHVWKKEQLRIQADLHKQHRKLQREASLSMKKNIEETSTSGHLKDKIKRRKSRNSISNFEPIEDEGSKGI